MPRRGKLFAPVGVAIGRSRRTTGDGAVGTSLIGGSLSAGHGMHSMEWISHCECFHHQRTYPIQLSVLPPTLHPLSFTRSEETVRNIVPDMSPVVHWQERHGTLEPIAAVLVGWEERLVMGAS
jgi:hypothetical protein